ncbi:MAG: hypothetical protein GF329_11500 [Candidatus Lokiarchaeota archaeon]|nr:hypothetical protein [Candidatus Lokiarchaeota archaeon]
MSFLKNIGGFLFKPQKQAKKFLSNTKVSNKPLKTVLFVLYGSCVLSITMVFFILIPEILYYGIPIGMEYQNLLFINFSKPSIIIGLFLVGMIMFFGIFFLLIGTMNFLISRTYIKFNLTFKRYKTYLTIFGYSILPLLLFGIITIFWIYFVEKLYIATEIPPLIDFTFNNIIYIILYFVFTIWKLIIETRINQEYFKISVYKAIIPEIIQLFLLFGFFFLINILGSALGASLDVV